MELLSEAEFNQLSNCIEIAHKAESQRLPMIQAAELAFELARLRTKVRAFVLKPEEKKPCPSTDAKEQKS